MVMNLVVVGDVDMAWLIMNDEVDYPVMWYPTHIVSKDRKVIPLFIGASQTIKKGLVGLYVRDEHYPLIRHDKAYILIHDPDVTDEDVLNIEWEKIEDNDDKLSASRAHYHIWKEEEPKLDNQNVEQGGNA